MVSKDSQMQIKHENGYCALYINGKFECNCDTIEEAVKEYEKAMEDCNEEIFQ